MTETERIVEQLKRAFHGGAWHGPSVMETLAGVDARQASSRSLGSAHTIWEIALHIGTWEKVARRRIEEGAFDPTDAEDWTIPGEQSDDAWAATLQSLQDENAALRSAIDRMDEARLAETVPGATYDFYILLHGVVQHDLYHAGQIAILKKAEN